MSGTGSLSGSGSLLESFDFLYMPSRDVATDLAFYADVLRARVIFAIEAFDARVAEVRLTEGGPRLLLADARPVRDVPHAGRPAACRVRAHPPRGRRPLRRTARLRSGSSGLSC
jgi:hypothetical protein